ncbi:bifunctional tRNA (5-methylaminomethyl-2-thiouridine)(34)-methyltransferase MnmD/FAD-dependent 5-carboxymethylaminomethyl-2-thiouridine(34) oxidoreductase MnmC [Amantichitinum ursilacus]|uniref:tRNA 5-methylaminomethyl-2-thiouridine biosynthesis bifunctional protein MnmC n=1 Tax=Amantichitinum ursilacus TaxID=857265 RepID=A0A0N0XGZ6_9NEIS|nr:bifunctional tRNA (5-methylaminomethyl-2-thiouridine)(34)-methyltransferase MnmD/FAD-dependent 5-carboxymethylaminomethyl-2-thiouridine(34) oxidoreductase MnmC [Amantichitinum ursilacus]KPC50552.1 tRNA 5-methylaminomethyl-2-thiouridine biosynthesis bifunctional protein MnmC [Amantichitinum ursilacus]
MPERLIPARLQFNAEGVPWSADFDDVYHSADGGIEQAQAVFMAGNHLPQRWQGREQFCIVETGFGQGLNFLTTWQAWRDDPHRCARLHFVSVEKHPFAAADLAQLHARYPALAELSAQLLAQWPLLTPGLHRLHLDAGSVTLTLLFGEAETLLRQLDMQADAIYLDGFSPGKNEDLWSPAVFRALWLLGKPDTTLATYTVAGAVRNGLKDAGFMPRKVEGFGRKRQRLEGSMARSPRRVALTHPAHTAIVIGAGLAGCAAAERLAARGWQVTVIERDAAPAQHASGNHVGLMHAHFSRDDNLSARLTRAGSEYTLRHLQAIGDAARWGMQGVLQIARTDEQAATQAEMGADGWPDELMRYVDVDAASAMAGQRVPRSGLWYARGIWANPASVCHANLQRHGAHVQLRTGITVARLQRDGALWQAQTAEGEVVATAAVVILAQATAATALEQAAELPLSSSARSTTLLREGALPLAQIGLSGAGYITPALDGWHCMGAAGAHDEVEAARGNLQSLQELFPQAALPGAAALGSTRLCPRPTSPDRMPLVGALPLPLAQQTKAHQLPQVQRWPGVYGLLGLGSRGLTFSLLCAELLASQLNAEPLPVETALADAVDPARFMLRTLRKAS